jgi:hypothetical protein
MHVFVCKYIQYMYSVVVVHTLNLFRYGLTCIHIACMYLYVSTCSFQCSCGSPFLLHVLYNLLKRLICLLRLFAAINLLPFLQRF